LLPRLCFLSPRPCVLSQNRNSLTAAYIVTDIGGETTYPWLGIAYSISAAAVSPAVGGVSDFLARRCLLLAGNVIVIGGMVIVGSAGEMSVAIGGMAVAGVGAALAGVVAVAAVCEIVPVQERGKYIGTGFVLLLPFSAIPAYGTFALLRVLIQRNCIRLLQLGVGVRGFQSSSLV
jgi:MFS family permease